MSALSLSLQVPSAGDGPRIHPLRPNPFDVAVAGRELPTVSAELEGHESHGELEVPEVEAMVAQVEQRARPRHGAAG